VAREIEQAYQALQAKQSNQEDQAKDKQKAEETQEDQEDPFWEKLGQRNLHPSDEERLATYNKSREGHKFLSYIKAEQVLAWFRTMREKQDGYEEILRLAMAAASMERPEDLVDSIQKQG
jgi:hypothetical protein